MRLNRFGNQTGIALLLTLTVTTILISVALALNQRMLSRAEDASAARDRVMLNHMLESGVNAGIALLVKDRLETETDSMQEDWAQPQALKQLCAEIVFETGQIDIGIVDERGKIQVNALVAFPHPHQPNDSQMFMWERFLTLLKNQQDAFAEIEPRAIVNALKDWIDSADDDMISGLSGAESSYYQGLDPPYACRNGPMAHLAELPRVKGIDAALLHGAGGGGGIDAYLTTAGAGQTPEGAFEFNGKININTADLPVIAALLPEDSTDLAQSIYDYRREMSDGKFIHDLSGAQWYRQAPGCGSVTIDDQLLTNAGDLFTITVKATRQGRQARARALVERRQMKKTNQWTGKILRWQADYPHPIAANGTTEAS